MPNPIGRALRDRRAGHDKVVWERAGLQAPDSFTLTSPAFAGGGPIPEEYKGRLFGQDLSPELAWTAPPVATEELVLVVEDPDAPRRQPAVHVIACGIDPALGGLPEGALARHTPPDGVAYGRGSCARATIGWFTATASRVPSGAQIAAAIRVESPSRRASHQPATSSPANTTSP